MKSPEKSGFFVFTYIMSPPEIWGPPVWTFFHTLAENINEEGFSNIKSLPLTECIQTPVVAYLIENLQGLQVDVFPRIPVLTSNGSKDFAGSWAVSMAKKERPNIFTVDMGGGAVYLYDNQGIKYDIFKKNNDGKEQSLKPNIIFDKMKIDDQSDSEKIKNEMTSAVSDYLPEIYAKTSELMSLRNLGKASENNPTSNTILQNQAQLQMPIEQPSNKPEPLIKQKSVKQRGKNAEAKHVALQILGRSKPGTVVKGGYKKTKRKKNKKTNKIKKSKTHKRYK